MDQYKNFQSSLNFCVCVLNLECEDVSDILRTTKQIISVGSCHFIGHVASSLSLRLPHVLMWGRVVSTMVGDEVVMSMVFNTSK